jgi:energy-coupling factor transport system ATP-binding protein
MIEFKEVYFKYPFEDTYALKNINIRISKGECVFIMGSNGAGKTTLIKHINGILKPTKGEVWVNGKNTKNFTVAELSKIVGIVFQNPDHQIFASSVYEEVAFALRNFKFDEKYIENKVNETLKFFSLEKYKEASPLFLSGGEKKRVTIASVVCYEPEILVLDEPTVGLDLKQRKNLVNLINELKKMNKTIIVVTHDIDFAIELANRVIIMNEGEVLKEGSISDIIYDEETLRKANLIQPIIPQVVTKLKLSISSKKIITIEDFLTNLEIILKNVKT